MCAASKNLIHQRFLDDPGGLGGIQKFLAHPRERDIPISGRSKGNVQVELGLGVSRQVGDSNGEC